MIKDRPMEGVNLVSQKMGLHDWIYHNEYSDDKRQIVPHADLKEALKSVKKEVELGYDKLLSAREASRCLNCDVQTIFNEKICIECDACADICPVECINFMENGDEADVRERTRIPARNKEQPLYISGVLKTGKVMIKDEDLCLHCAMCAERCPTSAWDMQKFTLGKFEKVKV
jgi:ferredoxin